MFTSLDPIPGETDSIYLEMITFLAQSLHRHSLFQECFACEFPFHASLTFNHISVSLFEE